MDAVTFACCNESHFGNASSCDETHVPANKIRKTAEI